MPSDHDAAAAQVRSVRPLLAAARSKRGGGEQEVEASRKRPRRGAAIRASQAWTLDHSTASLVFEPLEGCACEAAVIWLHGLDDTPEPWANRLAAERHRRPRWKWIHLRVQHAQRRLARCPSSFRVPFPRRAWRLWAARRPQGVDWASCAPNHCLGVSRASSLQGRRSPCV